MEAAQIEIRALSFLDQLGEFVVRRIRDWIVVIVSVLIFLPLIGVAMNLVFSLAGFAPGADFFRWLYSLNCHQIPCRCPTILSLPAILCFRCLGFYSGLLLGWLLSISGPLQGKRRFIIPAILIPAAVNLVDVAGISIGLWDGSNAFRFAIGLSAGAGPAYLVMHGVRKVATQHRRGKKSR